MSVPMVTIRHILVASAVAVLGLAALARAVPPPGGEGSAASLAAQDLVADPGFVDVLAVRGGGRGRPADPASPAARDDATAAACEPTCSCECD